MKVGMLSPYSLSRPGGVQGQVFGLSRALRQLGHEVTVIGPVDEGASVVGEDVVVVGRPTGLRSNGSVAPVTISPMVSVGPSATCGTATLTCSTFMSRWRPW